MKNFWQNLGRDQTGERLKPIPEIPVPDEMSEVVPTSSTSVKSRLTRSRARRHSPGHKVHVVHIQFLLDVIGAPSLPIFSPHSTNYHDVETYREVGFDLASFFLLFFWTYCDYNFFWYVQKIKGLIHSPTVCCRVRWWRSWLDRKRERAREGDDGDRKPKY